MNDVARRSCGACGEGLVPGLRFCPACGTAAGELCPTCQWPLEPTWRFCASCGTAVRDGAHAVEIEREHVPRGLEDRIRGRRHVVAGERKLVTVLFCDLVGSTAIAEKLDPEEYRDLLDDYLELASRAIHETEGVINQLAGDGFMALFGAPVAHEDAPDRALRAAVAIREALAAREREGIRLELRIGIHTGPVVVGTVGNDLKMDYTAIGDTTNLAARFQALARPGQILASDATMRLVRARWETRTLDPVTVKGKQEPVTPWEILGEVEAPAAFADGKELTPFVNREAELAQLEGCFSRLAAGQAQIAAIVGDAGSGKSRLLHEFKKRFEPDSVELLEARCSSLARQAAFAPFAEMLRHRLGIARAHDPEEARATVRSTLVAIDPVLEAELDGLCRVLSLPAPSLADRSPEEVKQAAFHAVARFVMGLVATRPVVLVFEDLQWIDDVSREMLEAGVAEISRNRLMLVLTHRPDYEASWRASAAFTQLLLQPLDDASAASIVHSVAGGPLPEELERRILQRAEGNPFFAEEITRILVDEGYLLRGDGAVRVTKPIDEVRIPETVQEVVAARLDRLGPEPKRVVQVASALGRQFRRTLLEEILAGEVADVLEVLEALERAGVLHRKNVLSDDEFRFGESVTQQVAYESLLLKERRRLHGVIAASLDAAPGTRTPERTAIVAHHYARSDEVGKALDALAAAAIEAEAQPSYAAAAEFYGEAWRIGRAGGPAHVAAALQAAVGYARMAAIYSRVDFARAAEVVTQARALAAEVGAAEAEASLTSLHGVIEMGRGPEHFSGGLELTERGVALAERHAPAPVALNGKRGLAIGYLLAGRIDDAMRLVDEIVSGMEAVGMREQMADAYLGTLWMRGRMLLWSGGIDAAEEACERALEMGRQGNNRTTISGVLATLATIHYLRGDAARTKDAAETSLEVGRAIQNQFTTQAVAPLLLAIGDELEVTEPKGRLVAEITRTTQAGGGMVTLNLPGIVEGLLAAGEAEKAERFAREVVGRAGGALSSGVARAMLALALESSEDAHEACRYAAEAWQALADVPSPLARTLAALAVARTHADAGCEAEAVAACEAAAESARGAGFARYQARAEAIARLVRMGAA